jgi:hypothetical protein
MKAANKLTDEEKDRRVEVEIQTAKQIATKLFQIVSNKEFVKEVSDPAQRHQVVAMQLKKMDESTGQKMYESFGSAYPIVMKYMTQYLSYNEVAFDKFLRKQAKDPGKGMDGFIEHQSNYVKFLYVETCRAAHKRPNLKEANKRKNAEFDIMNKARKEIEVNKKKAENEFDEENTHHLEERREELLEYINQELDGDMGFSEDSDADADVAADPAVPEMSNDDYFKSLSRKDQNAKLETLYFLERTYIEELDAKDKQIKEYENACVDAKIKKQNSFLEGTVASKTQPKRKPKSNKKSKK